ncbi:MAG: SxtJ family membrane protein [Desulfobacterium sp.]
MGYNEFDMEIKGDIKMQPLTRRGYRHFGFVLALFVAMLFGLLLPFLAGDASLMRPWPWFVSALLVGWGMLWPEGLRFIHGPWMAFGRFMATLNTTVILTIVFYLFITPMAIVFKILGKDSMERNLNPKNTNDSYWKKSSGRKKNEHMEKIY